LPLRFGSLLLWSLVLLDGKIKAQSFAGGRWSCTLELVLIRWLSSWMDSPPAMDRKSIWL
ncbi:hypothetical protein NEUTE2DRAFT_67501, partial [Neurospora tetrasperma FGSC 2509]